MALVQSSQRAQPGCLQHRPRFSRPHPEFGRDDQESLAAGTTPTPRRYRKQSGTQTRCAEDELSKTTCREPQTRRDVQSELDEMGRVGLYWIGEIVAKAMRARRAHAATAMPAHPQLSARKLISRKTVRETQAWTRYVSVSAKSKLNASRFSTMFTIVGIAGPRKTLYRR
jgi:hypothetical protein